MLHIKDLSYRIGDRLLFDRATVAIPAGKKVGLVGRNGAGKTTLMRLILGEVPAETGSISVPKRARITLVAQEAPDGEQSLIETVLAADEELMALEAAAARVTDPHRLADIHTRLADIGAAAAPARAAAILAGLGFDAEQQQRPCASFSGGWRMRVGLARALFTQPDLLLLDEPTNYLDLEGVLWLEHFLKGYPHTVLVISHDRDLLNTAVSGILHLTAGKLAFYAGGYDAFDRQRSDQLEREAKMKTKMEAQRRHLQSFVDRFRAKASKASQAQSRLKMLAKLTPSPAMVAEEARPFSFPKPEPLSPPLIALERAAVGYDPDRPVLSRLTLRVDMDDRIALLGANGQGKSTFAKLLCGKLKPVSGKLSKPKTLKIGYFAQHQLDELIPGQSPYDHLRRRMPEHPEARVRARLGSFGFSADKADRPVASLSGGEKARLLFALMAFDGPQLMILDEPTNHLDIDSRTALMHAINDYDGAVLLISHDRYLLEACADRIWVAEAGTVQPFDGDFETYRTQLLQARGASAGNEGPKGDSVRKRERRQSAQDRQRVAPLKQAVAEAENRHAELETQYGRLQTALASPKLYDGSDPKAAEKQQLLRSEQARLEQALLQAEEIWLARLKDLEEIGGNL
ncbi:MAG: ATP-binding cassette domain-containing protein [Rhodothalassiaceae bacterium]